MTQISSVSTYSFASILEEQLVILAQHYNFSKPLINRLKKIYHLLCHESLSGKMELPYGGLSRINSNGIPFQWSFSFAPNYQESLRFICETGTPYTSCYKRFQYSLLQIDDLNSLLNIPKTSWFKEQALPILMPEVSEWPNHWKSALWFAVGANKNGILYKIYLNLNVGDIRDRWSKVGRLLTVLNRLSSLKEWCAISADVSKNSIPVGIALDVLPNGECGRVKIYFRSEEVTLSWLARWYRATNGEAVEPMIRKLIESYPLTGTKVYPNQSFFVSWEAGAHEKATLKTELAITNFNFSEREVVNRTYSLMDKLNLQFGEYKKQLALIGYSEPYHINEKAHKFVGIGFENDGNFHLNTYVQPMLSQPDLVPRKEKNSSKRSSLDAVLHNAKNSLFNSLVDEKKWVDYQLPVGESDIWATANILFQLQNCQLTIEHSHLYTNAQKWLQEQVKPTGWGYNASTPSDSDSTSLALLSAIPNEKMAIAILTKLENHCKSEHGYGTYNSKIYKGHWSFGVDDVSPYVLLAQQKFNFNASAGLPDFICKNQLENGSWCSYWWISNLYATYGYLLYFKAINAKPPRLTALTDYLENYQAEGVFEKALLINCWHLIEPKKMISQLAENIVDQQGDNGLWNGSALLRLPKDELLEPRNKIEGTTLFKDVNGYLTTAMVIGALSKY